MSIGCTLQGSQGGSHCVLPLNVPRCYIHGSSGLLSSLRRELYFSMIQRRAYRHTVDRQTDIYVPSLLPNSIYWGFLTAGPLGRWMWVSTAAHKGMKQFQVQFSQLRSVVHTGLTSCLNGIRLSFDMSSAWAPPCFQQLYQIFSVSFNDASIYPTLTLKLKLVTYLLFCKRQNFYSEWYFIHVSLTVNKLVIKLLRCIKFLDKKPSFGLHKFPFLLELCA